jgi:protein-S-isoprenylcysteine O-methyltransferase Ste14
MDRRARGLGPGVGLARGFRDVCDCAGLALRRIDPGLVRERGQRAQEVEPWDQTVIVVYLLLLVVLPVVLQVPSALDGGRFGRSVLPLWALPPGVLIGAVFVHRTAREDPHAAREPGRLYRVCT